jgi:hypothetical protein
VADATLLEFAAPTNGVAAAALQRHSGRLWSRTQAPGPHKKGLHKTTDFPKKQLSLESAALRLALPFFMSPATTFPKALTVAKHAKANAARTEA